MPRGTDNQEKDEKQSQNDKTGLGIEKTVKEKPHQKAVTQGQCGPSFVPFGGSFPIDVANLPHDPLMPELEDTTEIQSIGICGNAYDDHDLDTLNTPYVIKDVALRLLREIPKDSSTKHRGMTKKNSGEHAMISYIQKARGQITKHFQKLIFCFPSNLNPKDILKPLDDESGKKAIGTKWVYRNKNDERGIVVRNKARLVSQRYKQEKGINYDEVFAPVARVEAMRFQMSSIGALTFFLGLQVKQKEDEIFISKDKYYVLRYSYEKRLIEMVKIHTDYNVADLLTKSFDVTRFQFFIASIASVRRHLQYTNADGISSLPNTEIFDQLTLMGTRTRRIGIRIPQSDVPISVADEAIIKEMHDGLVRATTTASSLEAEQGSGNIAKTQTKETLFGPSSPRTSSEGGLREGNTSRSGEGSMQLLELINLCTKLSDKVTSLEDELASTKAVYNEAPITLTKRVKKLEKQLKHKKRKAVIDSLEDEEPSLDAGDSPK
ncbi:putative ribonuclease H-like domain-containing protein [Tanacetum coccineum]